MPPRTIRISAALLAGAAILPAQASATPAPPGITLHVGDPSVRCSSLRPYDHAWRWRVGGADGTIRFQGIWSDHLDATTLNGRPVLRRVQGMTYLNGASRTDVLYFDRDSCAPISSEQHRLNGVVLRHRFAGTHASAERTQPPAPMAATSADLPEIPFDFLNGEDGPLLAALPLRTGFAATILAAQDLPVGDDVIPISLRVVREETIDGGGLGRVRTFVVESPLPGGEGVQTFYISAAPPYFIRLEVRLTDHRAYYFDNI